MTKTDPVVDTADTLEAAKVSEEFVALADHELRVPATVMLGVADTLESLRRRRGSVCRSLAGSRGRWEGS